MKEVTTIYLRDMVAEAIIPNIETHRSSRLSSDKEYYAPPTGLPTDEEIDDFLFHNALLDEETVEQLTDPGLYGFFTANATEDWLEEFRNHLQDWANNQSWLDADLPWHSFVTQHEPDETTLWIPANSLTPTWLSTSSSCLLLAADLLHEGRFLSELKPRAFEELIGSLLEVEGWKVKITQQTRDGGIDVVATRFDETLGEIRSVWQAKKYSQTNKVKLNEVRELSAVRDAEKATKGVIVTTSHLTRDAIGWVKRDVYRLGYKEHDHIKNWIEGIVLGQK